MVAIVGRPCENASTASIGIPCRSAHPRQARSTTRVESTNVPSISKSTALQVKVNGQSPVRKEHYRLLESSRACWVWANLSRAHQPYSLLVLGDLLISPSQDVDKPEMRADLFDLSDPGCYSSGLWSCSSPFFINDQRLGSSRSGAVGNVRGPSPCPDRTMLNSGLREIEEKYEAGNYAASL